MPRSVRLLVVVPGWVAALDAEAVHAPRSS
jgi:hypothetical protein